MGKKEEHSVGIRMGVVITWRRHDMGEASLIGVEEARRKLVAKEALLVCAYMDEAKCNRNKLEGAITLSELQSRLASLSKDQELIFFCA